jgi:hypothetical protein
MLVLDKYYCLLFSPPTAKWLMSLVVESAV